MTLPYGFGNLIPCFGNPQHHPWSDATDLRISPTPLSFSRGMSSSGRGGASAFSFTTTATLNTHAVPFLLDDFHHGVSFIDKSHHTTARRFFGISFLDQPLFVGIPAATVSILPFVVVHCFLCLSIIGFGRNLPHALVRDQLKTFLKIHKKWGRSSLESFSWSASLSSLTWASAWGCHGWVHE